MRLKFNYFILLLTGLLFTGCREDNVIPFTTDRQVNNWIYQEMKSWYYWSGNIPENPDYRQAPDVFFYGLLYSYHPTLRPDGDRFSWIQLSADELKSSLSGETTTTGMEYVLYTVEGSSDVFGTILYTLPGAPAALAGLQRGDFFTGINGTPLTSQNYRSLLGASGTKKYTLGTLNEAGKVIAGSREVTLTPVRFQEDPVHFDTLFTIGAKKIGYIVYHQFFPSANNSDDKLYDKKLERIFARFKQDNINELILDLRYNSGGYVSSATHLASLIAKGVTDESIFCLKEYNPAITGILKKKYGDDFFQDKFTSLPQNIGNQLQRVYVLTGKRTASASELMINGLKPYLSTVVVGQQTVGKNVGSVTISETKKRTNWGLQPIVSKSFNSLHQSDYAAGFVPDIPSDEGHVLYRYGDPRDPLLGPALEAIAGTVTARKSQPPGTLPVHELLSTLEPRAGYGNMFEVLPPPDDFNN